MTEPDEPAAVAWLADDALLVTLRGTLDLVRSEAAAGTIRETADDARLRRLVVDVTDAVVVEPGALGAVLDVARRLREVGGTVAMVVPAGGRLRPILDATGLPLAVQVYPTRRAALDDLDLDDPV